MSLNPPLDPHDRIKPAQVLILCYSDLATDARVLRQIDELVHQGLTVSTAALGPSGLDNGIHVLPGDVVSNDQIGRYLA